MDKKWTFGAVCSTYFLSFISCVLKVFSVETMVLVAFVSKSESLRYIFMLEKLGEQKQKPQIKRLPLAPQYSLLLWSRPNAIHLRNDWASSNQYKWKRAITWQMTHTGAVTIFLSRNSDIWIFVLKILEFLCFAFQYLNLCAKNQFWKFLDFRILSSTIWIYGQNMIFAPVCD